MITAAMWIGARVKWTALYVATAFAAIVKGFLGRDRDP